MKIISIVKVINRILIVLTVLSYVTIFIGFVFQTVLGIFQILSAIILSFYYNKIKKDRRLQLIFYWCFVITYGLLWFSSFRDVSNNFFDFILFYVLIPLSIAGYFTLILEPLKLEI
ncbi:hypothetical protein [Tenacibaculum ovolyticum]|uniref:hypothetical protein n=1 Tax=Tenacibaculum ovolyticum TaxID=104270 RepID=UPI0007EE0154|nr:hypothetical protein [Tenacibaculum ovolyticum]